MTTTETKKKHCWCCDSWFPATPEYFHRDSSTSSGLHGSCKPCVCERKRIWQATHRERAKIHVERCRYPNGHLLPFPSINRQAENMEYIWRAKELGCCICCGEVRTEVLLFHHRNPKDKKFNLSSPKSRDLSEIKAEIAKCDLMCANCHMSLHYWEKHK